jgi:trans-L-3-hydroxyproline dehydratase
MITLKTIDAHAGGAPLRLITDGAPSAHGRTMRGKCESFARRGDDVRRMLMLEPRGHQDMTGAMLTEPVTPGSHAGLLFMNAGGYAPLSVHGVIAATTIAIERRLVEPIGDDQTVVYDTMAGVVKARARVNAQGRVERVSVQLVPSFVLYAGLSVQAAGRRIRADVAFGGAFYAVVDAESIGLSTAPAHLSALREVGSEIIRAIEIVQDIVHPLDPRTTGLFATLFTGPSVGAHADLRGVTILSGGQAGRSPSGTGMAAVMTVLDAMGLLAGDVTFTQEGVLGERFTGRVTARTAVGELAAIVPEIEGSAWITGEHTWLADEADPFRLGAELS